MDSKTKTTIDSIKNLGGELSAWEVRLLAVQNEHKTLSERTGQIKKELESAMSVAQVDVDRKREMGKAEEARINGLKANLEAEKAEFQAILTAFKKEKNEFEREKTKILDIQRDTQILRDRTNNFIRLFKDEANKL